MLMVGTDVDQVERELRAGELTCPDCDGELRPWAWARRRLLRRPDGSVWFRPRRARCRSCRVTHVVMPVSALLRRRDAVEVIGAALVAKADGAGHRAIATSAGVPAATARGWLRRFAARAEFVRAHFTELGHVLDSSLVIEPRGSPVADALEAMGVAARAAAARFGPAPVWWFVSGASGGRLLTNTDSPFPRLR